MEWLAIAAAFALAAIAIYLIPDRHKPRWERDNRDDD